MVELFLSRNYEKNDPLPFHNVGLCTIADQTMQHVTTSQICADLPNELWEKILAKTDPFVCIILCRPRFAIRNWLSNGSHMRQEIIRKQFMEQAIRLNLLGVVQVLVQNGIRPDNLYDSAAKYGRLEIRKWFARYEFPFESVNGCLQLKWFQKGRLLKCTVQAMDSAAEHGHLDVVKWLYYNRMEGCTRDAEIMAAQNGHFDVLEWLKQNIRLYHRRPWE